jgi:polyisoprenoid-binding protein YceI
VSKFLGIGALALVLAACGVFQARHAGPKSPGPSPELQAQAPDEGSPGTIYRVDETESELRILVYRAGPLARLGHNHVMVNRKLRGAVNLAGAAGSGVAGAAGPSSFWLSVPSAAFDVDDPQARAEEGADFAAAVADDARFGTLQNMLGAAVLDAAEYPAITVRSVSVESPQGAEGATATDATATGATEATRTMIATVTVGVAGHESTIDVPFALQLESGRLSATGTLELRQSALGVTPYSLMLGALQVQDQMTIKFKIVAQTN